MATTTFSIDVKRWAAVTGLSIEQTVRAATLEIFTRVVRRSPVGNPSLWKYPAPDGYVGGQFRASWNVDQRKEGNPRAPEQFVIAQIANDVTSSEVGGIVSLINPMPYGPRLEYDHWSTQAPEGMIRITALEFGSIVEQEAAKERR